MEPIKLSDREYVTLVVAVYEFVAEYEDWIKLSDREYVTLVAGYELSDEEIREFVAEYEDWLYCFENVGGYDEAQYTETQPDR